MAQRVSEENLVFKPTDRMQRPSDLMKGKVILVPHMRKTSQLLRVIIKISAKFLHNLIIFILFLFLRKG